jgi:trk system potassium uptake protein
MVINPIARWISTETEERVFRILDRMLFVAGLLSMAVLVRQMGWGTGSGRVWGLSAYLGKLIILFFIVQAILRLLIHARPWIYLAQQKIHYLMVAFACINLAGLDHVAAFLRTSLPPAQVSMSLLVFLALSQLPLIGIATLQFAQHSTTLGFRFFNAGQLFSLTFGAAITLGALLLKMPNVTVEPSRFLWVDAFFISTSAVCVTGLATVDVATTFTPMGQAIILLLIQAGGLGIMSLTFLITMLASGGGSLRNRYAMQSLLDEQSLSEVGRALVQIAVFTMTFELIGAVLLYFSHTALSGLPWPERAFSALFHSVSAFCNAGFSLRSANLADPGLAGNTPFLFVIMALIVLGGLGFPVLRNLGQWLPAWITRKPLNETNRIHVHTRVVLLATGVLLVLGTLVFWLERPDGESPWLLHSLFLSVSARTAGFNTFDLSALNIYALVMLGVLMFIGGSPGGTAGGVRTTAITIILLDVWRVLRGRASQVLFRRKISRQIRDRAVATLFLALLAIGLGVTLVRIVQPGLPTAGVIFECISALGTVGLSLNLTPSLNPAAKWVIMALMFTGRIGVLLFLTSLFQNDEQERIQYPRGVINI